MSTGEKRRWPSAKARDYFCVPSADGHGDKNKLLCDLCHKPVKAPGGKSRPSIVRNILMYMSKFCFEFRKCFYRAMMPMLVNIFVKQVAIQSCIGSVMYRYTTDWEHVKCTVYIRCSAYKSYLTLALAPILTLTVFA